MNARGPIQFNRPFVTGNELDNIAEAQRNLQLAGDGPFTERCHGWIEAHTGCPKPLLTHSCTAALEMAALLLDIESGDEVIMPSFTFVSTANAFVLRGGRPVFVDVRRDTLNIDESLIEAAITPRTRAIAAVHYAGVAAEMDAICAIARRHNLKVVEDAAQGIMSQYKGRPLGTIGELGALSFHETKNVVSGEGGCLLVNEPSLAARAEIIREKGTDRSRFFRGEVDKYTWQEVGSSYLPGELVAAYLCAQLEHGERITRERLNIWQRYQALLEPMEKQGLVRRPVVPDACQHNAHMYYVILSSEFDRQPVLEALKENGIGALFHYVPLHSSPAGRRYCRAHGSLSTTDELAGQLVRLPMWIGLSLGQQERVATILMEALLVQGRERPQAAATKG